MKKKYVKPDMQDLKLPIVDAGVCGTGSDAGVCNSGTGVSGGTDCSSGTNPTGVCSNGTSVLYCTDGYSAVQY